MSASDTVLMVIDVQESFRQRPFWSDADCPTFIKRLQKLIHGANAQSIPVLQIFHIADAGPYSVASGFVKTLSPLSIEPDAVFYKRKPMTDARGRTWSSDEIKARSELVLDQRFARIATVEQALAGPASKLAS